MKGTNFVVKQFVFEVPTPNKRYGLPQKWLIYFLYIYIIFFFLLPFHFHVEYITLVGGFLLPHMRGFKIKEFKYYAELI